MVSFFKELNCRKVIFKAISEFKVIQELNISKLIIYKSWNFEIRNLKLIKYINLYIKISKKIF